LPQLQLSPASRILDLGCGPGGPLAFVVEHVGCHGLGIDRSAEALTVGRARVASLELGGLIALVQGDLNDPTPFAAGSFDAAISLDTVLHLRDRLAVFGEVKRHSLVETGGNELRIAVEGSQGDLVVG
jgi:cyclopropane fatty-acyl-phospholipid synthase-like methyltransferase